MNKNLNVVKRDGSKEILDLDKIHNVLTWACEGLRNVSISEIEIKSRFKFFDGITTKQIHQTLTKTSADLISEETPNYQYVASRLLNFNLRKEVYKNHEIPHLYSIVLENVAKGLYTKELLNWYSEDEFNKMQTFLVHRRDFNITYAGMEQWLGKYLVQNRVKKIYYETPQVSYMMIAATLFSSMDKENRLSYIKEYYDSLSLFDISIPTPVAAGARTNRKQFSSCVLISCGDSLTSISETTNAIYKYVSEKAGIGLNIGRIRPLGAEIRNGDVEHTGLIPFIKSFQSALKSCSQGGVRGGAGTAYYMWWHYEVENLLVIKNNKGTEETRARHLDYAMQFNRLFYERVKNNQNITLFNPHEVPELLEAFYSGDNVKFETLYEKYERSNKIKMKKTISAYQLLEMFVEERFNTGRIYLMNVDNSNHQTPFSEPIEQSNLCTEILLPTRPMGDTITETIKFENDQELLSILLTLNKDKSVNKFKINESSVEVEKNNGRIALCTLSAINWGNISKPEDFETPCKLAVTALDNLLSYQDYPLIESELSTREYRTLGIGINNLAYFLASHGKKYDDSALELVDEYMEAMSYYLIRASVDLAKERGACEKSKQTTYGQGIFPWELRKDAVDLLVPHKLRMDWESLRKDMITYGIRNATLMACMPSETSSILINSTNGVEPPRGYISQKRSKDGILKQVVPGYSTLKNKYDLLWDQKSPAGYLKIMCVLQKWIDQTISTNTSYNPEHFDGKVPIGQLIKDIFMFYKYGGKTLYYNNTFDGAGDEEPEQQLPKFQLPEMEHHNDDCDSCKI